MALLQTTLATGLEAIALAPSEVEATQVALFAAEFNTYMLGSSVLAVPMIPVPFGTAAEAAMVGAMTGLKTAGAAAILAGVTAYWAALNIAGVWGPTIPPTVPPPGLAGLSAALIPVFIANTAGGLAPAPAAAALAAAWHPLMLGGMANLPGPIPTPIL